jgi:hypothetical protein
MEDNTQVLLRLKANSQYYHFFVLTLSVLRACRSSQSFQMKLSALGSNQLVWMPNPKEEALVAEKLLKATEKKQPVVELSVRNVVLLLTAVGVILNGLLPESADITLEAVKESILDIGDNWQRGYFLSAQRLFEQLKCLIGHVKGFDALLSLIKSYQI